MPRVVIDARESGTSTGRYVDKLIENLHKQKPSLTVTVLAKEKRIDYIHQIAPKFEIINCPYKEFTFAEQIGLWKQVRGLKADLVHFTIVQQPILYWGKVVTTMHDLTTVRFRNPAKNWLVFTIKQQVYKWVNIIVARKSTTVITATEYTKDDIAKFTKVNSRKITVTHEAADEIQDKPKPVEGLEDKQFIMYVGRPLPHKNLPRLIDAFESLRQEFPALRLVLAGKRDKLYKAIARDVKRRNIQNIIFTGFVDEGELRWLYENTSAYVFPSLSEGFGLPGLEAMAHGAPVVSSNATCLPEVYGEAAAYFDPSDIEDMADKIGKVLRDESLRKKLITSGKKQASKYSWQKMAEQTLAVYNEILGK